MPRPRPGSRPKGARVNEPGGEVVSVVVRVNGNIEFVRYAVLERIQGNNVGRYKIDEDDRFITHNRDLGNKELAERLLKL
jgi:hypothetical protein